MELVSSQEEPQDDLQRAEDRVERELRHLAANLLRVMRGAGKPNDIIGQCAAVLHATINFKEVSGHNINPANFNGMLDVFQEPQGYETCSSASQRWHDNEWQMVRGALQMAASKLIAQPTQQAAGSREFYEGFAIIQRMREKNRIDTRGAFGVSGH